MVRVPPEKPVLISLDNRGFHVLAYNGIPEQEMVRLELELFDPNTGQGASANTLLDKRVFQELDHFMKQPPSGKAFLICIDTTKKEASWQMRRIPEESP